MVTGARSCLGCGALLGLPIGKLMRDQRWRIDDVQGRLLDS